MDSLACWAAGKERRMLQSCNFVLQLTTEEEHASNCQTHTHRVDNRGAGGVVHKLVQQIRQPKHALTVILTAGCPAFLASALGASRCVRFNPISRCHVRQQKSRGAREQRQNTFMKRYPCLWYLTRTLLVHKLAQQNRHRTCSFKHYMHVHTNHTHTQQTDTHTHTHATHVHE